jgi:rhodanese-related sulfurtransferase
MSTTPLRISPAEAHARMTDEGFTYLDVRTEEEFEDGHPTGAVNVPVMIQGAAGLEPNPDFVATVSAVFPRDAKLVVGCKAGGRSLRAAKELAAAGYTQILDQRAGWDGARGSFGEITEPGWSRVGLPSEKGAAEGRSYASLRARAKT